MARKRIPFAALAMFLGAAAAIIAILQYLRLELPGDSGPEYSISYYRLRGSAADLLVQGLLDENLREALGSPHEIMQNDILSHARKVQERFGEPIYGDAVMISDGNFTYFRHYADVDEYLHSAWGQGGRVPSPTTLNVFSGGNSPYSFFLPDLEAMDEFLLDMKVPDGYYVYHTADRRGQTIPHIWRYLIRDDLSSYEHLMATYLARVREERPAYGFDHPNIIRGLQWLTRNGLPEGFIIVKGEAQSHYGWQINATMRDLELEVLIVENVSDHSISVGNIEFKHMYSEDLRQGVMTDNILQNSESSERRLTNSQVLSAGEKVIIPIRISFVQNVPAIEYISPEYPNSSIPGRVDVPVYRVDFESHYFTKFAMQPVDIERDERPEFIERFDYGPAWLPTFVTIEGRRQPIRRADWSNIALGFGFEKGSCPFIFTRRNDHSPWINNGHVLLGATDRSRIKTDIKQLLYFDGSVMVRELEDEISYITSITLIVDMPDGGERRFSPSIGEGGHYIVTREGSIVLKFDNYNPQIHLNPRLEVVGYYRSFAAMNVESWN